MRRTPLLVAAIAAAVLAATTAGMIAAQADPPSSVSPDIVGGTPASQTYPFAGSLQLHHNGDPNWHLCGVTLVAASWAETNAHCVSNPPQTGSQARTAAERYAAWLSAAPDVDLSNPRIFHIRFGSNDRLHGGVVRHVTAITTYPTWAWGQPDAQGRIGDIALLHLDTPVTGLEPARILPVQANHPAREIGWGITTQQRAWGDAPAPQYLSQIDVPVAADARCRPAGIGTGEICLGVPAGGGGACFGDSGTAALQHVDGDWTTAVGSASRAFGLGMCGIHAMVYTDLDYYRPWMVRVAYRLSPGANTSGLNLAVAPH